VHEPHAWLLRAAQLPIVVGAPVEAAAAVVAVVAVGAVWAEVVVEVRQFKAVVAVGAAGSESRPSKPGEQLVVRHARRVKASTLRTWLLLRAWISASGGCPGCAENILLPVWGTPPPPRRIRSHFGYHPGIRD
jgi:hypothetical protein